ncbi:MAG TPA: LysR family transcriptional regulator [Gaiellales bacterium]|jgi:DNA-binding transcriptional LysR family regulator
MTTGGEPSWLGIEPRHLATLRAVARAGSFRGAAAELGYVPSAVSAHVGTLERTVGRELVSRRRGAGIELTEAGRVLLDHAEAILGRLRAAQADMTALAEEGAAPLRVGITQSVGIRALPDIVRRFGLVWPDVRIQPRESETDLDLYGGVEQAELDLTFVELPAPPGPYETLALLVDPYVLIVRSDSPLAHRPHCPTLTEIGGLELIGHTQCRGLRRVEDQIRAAGSEPHFAFRSDVNATVQALVAAGVGVAVMPGLGFDPADGRTVAFDLSRDVPPRTLALAWHRDRHVTAPMRAFIDASVSVFADLAGRSPAERRLRAVHEA